MGSIASDNFRVCLDCEHAQGPEHGRDRICKLAGVRLVAISIQGGCPEGKHEAADAVRTGCGGGGAGARPKATVATPQGKWPLKIKALALLAVPGERGVGDTAHRVLSHLGGDGVAKLYEEVTGRPCGCGDRIEKLNARYPYAPGE
jgi:hypothetical protein